MRSPARSAACLSSSWMSWSSVALKPTPSVGQPQQSVDLAAGEAAELAVRGRHDPCIVHRAVPVAEAIAAIAVLDLLLDPPAVW